MPLDPIFDGTPDEHFLFFRQAIRTNSTIEICASGWSEGRSEILSITVDATDIHV